jgi:glycosyltransferase involved in cell wall biosynthesis
MKKLYIDGLGLVEGHFSGIGQYILGILKWMDQILEKDKCSGKTTPRVIVVIPFDTVKKFKKFGFKHLEYKTFPLPFRYMAALWHRNWLPPIDLWCGRGNYIFPRFVDMRLAFSKSAAVILFDLSYEIHRQYSDEENAMFLSKGVRRSIKRTAKVIAISDNARDEIVKFYDLQPEKVIVATPATDPTMFYRRSPNEIMSVKKKYGIQGDYILTLSNLEPRKNLSTLVDAYCKLPRSTTDSVSLLLVGVTGWKTDELFETIIKKVEDGYKIIRPSSYVKDSDKPAIISGAKLLVYPSHYEGFGMPIVEALACGTPVISADNSSMPQAGGSITTMIDSKDVNGLVNAIESYLRDIDKMTAQSKVNGPKQSEKFSWVKSAQIILDAAGDSR